MIKLELVSKDFKRFTKDQLLAFLIAVKDLMTADPQFQGLMPQITALKDAITAWEVAMAATLEGGKIATQVQKEKKVLLINIADTLAGEVDTLADGDEKVVWAAGFNTIKTGSPITSIATPDIIYVKQGDESGSIKMKFSNVKGRTNFAIMIREAGKDEPQIKTSSRLNRTLSNLEPGKEVTLQAMAIGRNDLQSEWSKPVTFWVN
jgi:hypothetical protein